MATPVNYNPQSGIARAMFNFDAFGLQNFRLSGIVRVSVSDSFSYSDYLSPSYSAFDSDLWTPGSGEMSWPTTQTNNVSAILDIYSQFANIPFEWKGEYDVFTSGSDTTVNPEDVGRNRLSDINISVIYRTDVYWAGRSGLNADGFHGYTGGTGDIFINSAEFGDFSFGTGAKARQVLMHELGHSLGMSHPHTAYNYTSGVATVSTDFAATQYLGFSRLGFRVASAADMNKEYFTIMSYDDQASYYAYTRFNAYTPMILDVIALQEAYGEGAGTTGTGNDTIRAGIVGYRTYFDRGGTDTIDLALYSDGAYLNMGEDITGAPHKVGVSMSFDDARNTIVNAEDPQHLRWFYGEYENAIGSAFADVIVDNSINNSINGGAGDDQIIVRGGNDTVVGDTGYDTVIYLYNYTDYSITYNPVSGAFTVSDRTSGRDGIDTVSSVEEFSFSDISKAAASLIAAANADTTPPTVLTFSPVDEATGVAISSNIVVTFSETITRGSGTITLRTATGAVIETYSAATSSNVSISGSSLTLNPTADLASGTSYLVEFAPGTIKDLAGNSYAGSTNYNFTARSSSLQGTSGDDNIVGTQYYETIYGLAGNDTIMAWDHDVIIYGGAGNDVAYCYGGNNFLYGESGNDKFIAGWASAGNEGIDWFDGGSGIDTVVFSGNRSDFRLTRSNGNLLAYGNLSAPDTLVSVERVWFQDVSWANLPEKLAFDIDGSAGMTAKILGAVFGRESLANRSYVGTGLNLLDGGMSYQDLMQLALNAKLGNGFSTTNEITLLYQNLLGIQPSASDLSYWTNAVNSGQFTQASLAVMAADTTFNATNINLVGLAQTGIEYS